MDKAAIYHNDMSGKENERGTEMTDAIHGEKPVDWTVLYDGDHRSPSTTEDVLGVEKAEQLDTSSEAISPPDSNPIPDGGFLAWLQVLGSFFLFMNCWGIVNAFGAFQTYYQLNLLSTSTPSNISWIGSIQAFLLLLVGTLTGPLFDAGYFRSLLLSGSSLLVFGTMMTSIARNYWEIMLSQALCMGLGCGLIFVPSIAILPTYFSTKRAVALGLAASGSSFGNAPAIFCLRLSRC